MSKGDWEVYEEADKRPTETTENERTACEKYGHSFETVVDDEGEPLNFAGDFVKKCNDCGATYTYDPEDETDG